MTIHERLGRLRTNLGLTTRAFGEKIGMSGGIITNMEKGRRNLTDRTIKEICREYGVRLEWLVNGTEPIFDDAFDGLDVSEEVKQLSDEYSRLNDSDKLLVRGLIQSLGEKSTPAE